MKTKGLPTNKFSKLKHYLMIDFQFYFNITFSINPLVPNAHKSARIAKILILKLDVNPQRDDDASPMSTYRCMLRPT